MTAWHKLLIDRMMIPMLSLVKRIPRTFEELNQQKSAYIVEEGLLFDQFQVARMFSVQYICLKLFYKNFQPTK